MHGIYPYRCFALPYGLFTFVAGMACITLITDFGLLDASVGNIKGVLLQKVPAIPILDITHEVTPYHLQQAAYLLNASYQHFPTGSFHIVLCDVFYSSNPVLILCKKGGHYFIAPDNGILSLAFNKDYQDAWQCITLQDAPSLKALITKVATIISNIDLGVQLTDEEFKPCEMHNALMQWEPRIIGNTVECHIMHVDRFENVIVNITRQQFEDIRHGRNFKISFFLDAITEISNHYSEVKKGEMLCRFNSAGYLEIAINRDKAASLLGLKLNKEQHLIYKAIKIVFE